jgi:diacylglycerol kinase (ATP)
MDCLVVGFDRGTCVSGKEKARKHRKAEKRHKAEVHDAQRLARTAAKLARHLAILDRKEIALAHAAAEGGGSHDSVANVTGEDGEEAPVVKGTNGEAGTDERARLATTYEALSTRQRALLIINSKSGPKRDSLMRVRDLAEKLDSLGIQADVTVKIRKRQARSDARKAAKRGYPLVIAAGGDGTVEAVARGLVGTETVLGVIPLGTYNNVAACLGIPNDVDAACALIATGPTRAIDVGRVLARGMKKPKLFMEMAGAGLAAALMPVGQHVEKGRWDEAAKLLPAALSLEPTETQIFLDGARHPGLWRTLLVEVANSPRNGPGLVTASNALMDDGMLDLQVYEDFNRSDIAAHFLALQMGAQPKEKQIHRMWARRARSTACGPAEPRSALGWRCRLWLIPKSWAPRQRASTCFPAHSW